MNIQFKTLALLAVLSIAAVGCQKETIVEPTAQFQQNVVARYATYTIDGITMHTTIYGEQNWHNFIDWLLTKAEEGHRVSFHNGNYNSTFASSKKTVTFKTTDKNQANAWCNEMAEAGYVVSMEYDESTGTYFCTAIGPDEPGSQSDTTGVL